MNVLVIIIQINQRRQIPWKQILDDGNPPLFHKFVIEEYELSEVGLVLETIGLIKTIKRISKDLTHRAIGTIAYHFGNYRKVAEFWENDTGPKTSKKYIFLFPFLSKIFPRIKYVFLRFFHQYITTEGLNFQAVRVVLFIPA